ncbi:DUF4397 domain-containing protein [Halobellus captivus]|uniref:DUF4397 domain-containing protein n=1 Tax=Halobellus captivus TaxID=2592614 RepID=UPI0011A4F23B|nr:DUF4397 domain-containing protein [Halobellus captivus]
MPVSNTTRRRVLQGTGAIGLAGLGSTVVTAQTEDGESTAQNGDGESTAIRVAHASPDAPTVDVRLRSTNGDEMASDENETEAEAGTETEDGQGDAVATIEGLEYADVSEYNEIDPGSYQVEIVPAEGGLFEGGIEDLFGNGEEDETVLFEEQLDVEEGTTYTVVAFGEVAQGPVSADGAGTGTGMADNETDTDGASEDPGGVEADESESTGGVDQDDTATDGLADAQTEGAQTEPLVSELAFGEYESVELDAENYTLVFRREDASETGVGTEADSGGEEIEGEDDIGTETDDISDDETSVTAGGADTEEGLTTQGGGSDTGFQVSVLEDDLSDPGEETARLRVFHAVPDVDTVSVSRVAEPTGGEGGVDTQTDDGLGDTQTDDGLGDTQTDDGLGDAETEDGDLGGNGTEDGGISSTDEDLRPFQFSAETNTVYSGFAVGYFDPEAAAAGDAQDGGDNETGNGAVSEEVENREFEFVTVEDAREGERTNSSGEALSLPPLAE